MNRFWILPVLALAGIAFAGWTSLAAAPSQAAAPGFTAPPAPAFAHLVAGTGLIEPASQDLALGTPVGALVAEVLVTAGDQVPAGAPLVRLDARAERAALGRAEAQLLAARSRLAQIRAQPRAEDLPPAEARVAQARIALADWRDQFARAESTAKEGISSQDELMRRRFAVDAAAARLAEAEAALARLRAGPWAPDLAVAEAEVATAAAEVASANTALARLVIAAPVAGTILAVDVRPGEYAAPGGKALITLGDTSHLHLRIDIDEQDAWRLKPAAAGTATLRGDPGRRWKLTPVRIEPRVVPKRNLSGDGGERIDTRVLQLIYRIEAPQDLRAGQRLDAQLEAIDR